MDPTEYGWLITIAFIGYPSVTLFIAYLDVPVFFNELCAIAAEDKQDSCLAQLPTLQFSLSRLVRISDLLVLLNTWVLPQIGGSVFYWDCCIMISCAREVEEALGLDIGKCNTMKPFKDEDPV